jgi:hypothetical protein
MQGRRRYIICSKREKRVHNIIRCQKEEEINCIICGEMCEGGEDTLSDVDVLFVLRPRRTYIIYL